MPDMSVRDPKLEIQSNISKVVQLCKFIDVKDKVVIIWVPSSDLFVMDDDSLTQYCTTLYEKLGIKEIIILSEGTNITTLSNEELESLSLRRIKDATSEGEKQESSESEHKSITVRRLSTEAVSSNSLQQSGEESQEKEVSSRKQVYDYLSGILARTRHLYSTGENQAFAQLIHITRDRIEHETSRTHRMRSFTYPSDI